MSYLFNFLIKILLPLLPKWFIKKIAINYVAGTTNEAIIKAIKKINHQGFAATIDILGEHTKSQIKADEIKNEF